MSGSHRQLIYIDSEMARLSRFSASSGARANVVKIELTVTDAYQLGRLMEQLQLFADTQRKADVVKAKKAAGL
jgi:hypothetical protein